MNGGSAAVEPEARVCGVDEAGRGPLAGPVCVAAVCFAAGRVPAGLNDSKKLSAKKRAILEVEIKRVAVGWSVQTLSPEEIDRLNIFAATMEGMARAVESLEFVPSECLIDGNAVPKRLAETGVCCRAIVGGDALEPAIMAASILAKEERDRLMLRLSKDHPEFGFERHKGYPTKAHVEALRRFGPIAGVHRTSYAPVREALARAGVSAARPKP